MNRILRVLFVLVLFELGIFLIILPWSAIWEQNFFLNRYPSLIHILLNPAMRGIVSGLGLLDIFVAIGLLRRPPALAIPGTPGELPPSAGDPIH